MIIPASCPRNDIVCHIAPNQHYSLYFMITSHIIQVHRCIVALRESFTCCVTSSSSFGTEISSYFLIFTTGWKAIYITARILYDPVKLTYKPALWLFTVWQAWLFYIGVLGVYHCLSWELYGSSSFIIPYHILQLWWCYRWTWALYRMVISNYLDLEYTYLGLWLLVCRMQVILILFYWGCLIIAIRTPNQAPLSALCL